MDLKNIKLVATDCDGCLTDGGMYITDSGDEFKRFSVLDGQGFVSLQNAGIKTAIITTSLNKSVQIRAEKLHVSDLVSGTADKLAAVKMLCEKYGFTLDEVAYLGDDINDLPAIEACGFACVPGSALENIKEKADYVTKRAGGDGAFRDVAELILASKI